MKTITIDSIQFHVEFDKSQYLLPRAGGSRDCGVCTPCLRRAGGEHGGPDCTNAKEWIDCPAEWHDLARDLAFQRFEAEVDSNNIDHLYTAGGVAVLAHFNDSHDDKNNRIEAGRPSGLHFPVLGRGLLPRGTEFMSGVMSGKRVVSILAFDEDTDTE